MGRPDFLENSMIVAAHPDDELLWFNAILHDVDEVIIVYDEFWAAPEIGAARRSAVAELPLGKVELLGIAESGAAGLADWDNPVPDEFGLRLSASANLLRESKRRVLRSLNGAFNTGFACSPDNVISVYRKNFLRLRELLAKRIPPGTNVFTHNPWGEYGHEEHVHLFRVLEGLRDEIGFNLWMSNYCTPRALPLARRYFGPRMPEYRRLPTNKEFAEQIADIYKRHGCWTWSDDWAWFEDECYMLAPRPKDEPLAAARLMPMNLFMLDLK